MIIIMKQGAATRNISAVISRIENLGYRIHLSEGEERAIIGIIGNGRPIEQDQVKRMEDVETVVRVTKPYKLASREFHPEDTTFKVGGVTIGSENLVIIGGPCSVESRSQIIETAHAVKEAGGHILRGGAYKPRSSPYSFQGLGIKGLEYLAEAREQTGLPIISEVMEPAMVSVVGEYVDILQIGARNMQNYALLNAAGKSQKPIMLKRGPSSTIEEWLLSAEYILNHGNSRLILCERGIRTFETATRNTFDINAIPLLRQLTHLPIFADPSHGTGRWELVTAVTRAAVAAGAQGVIVEVHPHPENALSDGAQSLKPVRFAKLVEQIQTLKMYLPKRKND
ncbi:MAG TPA: 3-deoxy-7-phosphoheptulonate synthase [Anaerolineae bacterium]|nr:3-deoxy-7-phosphoheptulonate synthase [Anaerolineae bacterium]